MFAILQNQYINMNKLIFFAILLKTGFVQAIEDEFDFPVVPDITLSANDVNLDTSQIHGSFPNYSAVHVKVSSRKRAIAFVDALAHLNENLSIVLSIIWNYGYTNPRDSLALLNLTENGGKISSLILTEEGNYNMENTFSYDPNQIRHPVNLTGKEEYYHNYSKLLRELSPSTKFIFDRADFQRHWTVERYSAMLEFADGVKFQFQVPLVILTFPQLRDLYLSELSADVDFFRRLKPSCFIIIKLVPSGTEDNTIWLDYNGRQNYLLKLSQLVDQLGREFRLKIIISKSLLPIQPIQGKKIQPAPKFPPPKAITLNQYSFREGGAPWNHPWNGPAIGEALRMTAPEYRILVTNFRETTYYFDKILMALWQLNYSEKLGWKSNPSEEELSLWVIVDSGNIDDALDYLTDSSAARRGHTITTLVIGIQQLQQYLSEGGGGGRGGNTNASLQSNAMKLRRAFNEANASMACKFDYSRPDSSSTLFPNPMEEEQKNLVGSLCDLTMLTWSFINKTPRLGQYDSFTSSFLPDLLKLSTRASNFLRDNPKTKIVFDLNLLWPHSEIEQPCLDGSLTVSDFWEMIKSWGELNSVILVEGKAFSYCTPKHFDYGRFNPLSRQNLAESEMYTDGWKEPCIRWNPNRIDKPLEFSKFPGMTLSAPVKKRMWGDDESGMRTALRFLFAKFSTVEVNVKQFEKIWETAKTLPEVKERPGKIYVSIGKEELLRLESTPSRLSVTEQLISPAGNGNDSTYPVSRVPMTLAGIHFPYVKPSMTNDSKIGEAVAYLERESEFQGIPVGLVLPEKVCSDLAYHMRYGRYASMWLHEIPYLGNVSYVMCEYYYDQLGWDSLQRVVLEYFTLYERFRKILFLQWLIHEKYPGIELKVKFSWPSAPPSSSSPSNFTTEDVRGPNMERFIRFWNFVEGFAKANKISYFISQAFDDDDDGNEGSKTGWWKLTNGQPFSDPSAYIEKESEYLGLNTTRPKAEEAELDPFDFVYLGLGILGGILILLAIILTLFIRLRKTNAILSNEEVKEILEGSSSMGQDETGSIELDVKVDGISVARLKYDRKFELPKSQLHIDKREVLGSGAFGIVYKCWVGDMDKEAEFAVKIPNAKSRETLKSALSEIKVMSHLWSGGGGVGQEHILKFVGAYTKEARIGNLYMVTELCRGGSLQSYLRSKSIPKSELLRFSYEIASGMEFISGKRVVHGDLSARNVLLDGDGRCKVSDFGLSRKIYEYSSYIKMNQEPLPWRWMAVEALDKLELSIKSDVWGFGVTVWEIFSGGKLPYSGITWTTDFSKQLADGLRLHQPENGTPAIYEQLMGCWAIIPEDRPSFSTLAAFFSLQRNEEYDTVG